MANRLRIISMLLLATLPATALAQSDTVKRFVASHCIDCHSGDEPDGRLDAEFLRFDPSDTDNFDVWVKILDRVEAGEMPPADADQPTAFQRKAFVKALKTSLLNASRQRYAAMGRTTIRRLNRFEYERTVQDLLGITKPLAHLLPEDTPLHGFDTVSDGLRFSALHIDKYLTAADAAIDEALRFTEQPEAEARRFDYNKQKGIVQNANEGNSIVRLHPNGAVLFQDASYVTKMHGVRLRTGGMYRIRIRGRAIQSQRPVVLRFHAGSYKSGTVRLLGFWDMPPNESREVETTARLEYNEYLYPAPDDLYADPTNRGVWNVGAEVFQGSGLLVEWVEIEGPLHEQWPPKSVGRLLGDTPIERLKKKRWIDGETLVYEAKPVDAKASVRKLIPEFARRAFRRPLKKGEATRFVDLALDALNDERSFVDAMRIGARAILASPQFLILDESPGQLDNYALASRLSYFLWGTMPDAELLKLAKAGRLSDSTVLREQTERLLKDKRRERFVASFAGQWLDLRSIDNTTPDKRLYPEFDEILKRSMIAETEGFVSELIDKDLPPSNFIDSDFSMLNRRLAEHYGIEGVEGQTNQRVQLPEESPRGGVLTQAAVLKVTANGTVTSPVTRGAWVMTRLLNKAPSPPPPSVGSIEPDTRGATTVREQLAKHRNNESCNSCHATIDPPGFALESFDVIGGFRKHYRSKKDGERIQQKLRGRDIWEYKRGPDVDATGQLATGEKFVDIKQFKQLLKKHEATVARTVASNLLIYATGHQVELADRPVVDRILENTAATDHGLRSLIHEVVQSDLFRNK